MTTFLVIPPNLREINERNRRYFQQNLEQNRLFYKNPEQFQPDNSQEFSPGTDLKQLLNELNQFLIFVLARTDKGLEVLLDYEKVECEENSVSLYFRLDSPGDHFFSQLVMKNQDGKILDLSMQRQISLKKNDVRLICFQIQIDHPYQVPIFSGCELREIS